MRKNILIFSMIACMLFSGVAWGQDVSARALLNYEIDEWGILALHVAGVDMEGTALESVEGSEITTDHEAYMMGLLALGRDVSKEAALVEGSQMPDGKFADYIGGTGDDLLNAHIWGIIALESAGNTSYDKEKAQEWLLDNQNEDGGFPVYIGMRESDVDLTAMAVVALDLMELKGAEASIEAAFEFIESNNEYKETAESIAWEIIARKQTGLEIGENIKARLEAYRLENGSYLHLRTMSSGNYMASWHGVWAESELKRRLTVFDGFKARNSLTDIGLDTQAYDAIKRLVEDGVLAGYPDRTFRPEAPVKRGEFVKMLAFAMDKENETALNAGFDDMKGHWASSYVDIAVENKLFNGVSDKLFDPESGITGAQFAAVAVRARGLDAEAKAFNGDTGYDGYVYYAWLHDLQYEGFDIEKEATRAQCAELIDNLY
ncbi:MAG: S-layer homology domain-containing protein [Peptostreptococcaceae bacterium]|nr:S-layer homology domain-containing protein [Peptostreptococcaceae bacterium]